jgi:hypothetical protein
MIRKVGSGYAVFSSEGKQLSKSYGTRAQALKRLKQIEFFKNKK